MKKITESLNLKALSLWLVIGVLGIAGAFIAVKAYNGQLFGDCNNCTVNLSEVASDVLGAVSDARPARLLTLKYLQVENDADIDGTLNVDGAVTITGAATAASLTTTGAISGLQSVSKITTAVASTTLATTDSGKNYILTTTTEFVLPATSTASGVYYRFTIGGAITSNVTIRTSDLGDNIEGTLIVAGAVVDCAAEDTITFVADGENIGDYVELYSDGTYWYIGDSGALTTSKLTCTAS